MTIKAQTGPPMRRLTADALAAELEQVECASVLVVSAGDRGTAINLTRAYERLRVHVDPKRFVGEWELF